MIALKSHRTIYNVANQLDHRPTGEAHPHPFPIRNFQDPAEKKEKKKSTKELKSVISCLFYWDTKAKNHVVVVAVVNPSIHPRLFGQKGRKR